MCVRTTSPISNYSCPFVLDCVPKTNLVENFSVPAYEPISCPHCHDQWTLGSLPSWKRFSVPLTLNGLVTSTSKLDLVVVVGNDPTSPYGTGLQSAHDPYVSTQPLFLKAIFHEPSLTGLYRFPAVPCHQYQWVHPLVQVKQSDQLFVSVECFKK